MKTVLACPVLLWLVLAQQVAAAEPATPLDIRRAVPDDVFLVVYGKHNPERDFQTQYYRDVWETVQETKIIERAVKIVTSRMSEQDLDQAQGVLDELRTAVEPIDMEAVVNCQELIYAQRMQIPTSHHLVLLRSTPEAADGIAQGITNLFGIAKKYLGEAVTINTRAVGDAELTSLEFPAQVPFQPTVVRLRDVVMLSSSESTAEQSLKMLTTGSGDSKFDDPRLQEALQKLPAVEDALVFYDGRTQAEDLRALGPFIRIASNNDPGAEKVVQILELAIRELMILDYEVTVEYTEGNLNRSASYGRLLPGSEDAVLREVLSSGQPFENWPSWVPADAISYSLGTGANLHPLYEKVLSVLNDKFPESKAALEQFAQLQQQYDVHLDRDILQAFSGEYVAVTVPCQQVSPLGPATASFLALRCHKPERIRELLHRAVDALAQHPVAKSQQLGLQEVEQLEGFEALSLSMLGVLGVQPVVGFRDGYMMLGSNMDVVQQVLKRQAGEGQSIRDTESFQQFQLDVEGPVDSIRYANTAQQTRDLAKLVSQVGFFVSMGLSAAGAQADNEELKPLQEAIALMPDLGRIIAKFDFLEARLTVTQAGDQPDTYRKRAVQVVRAPEQDEGAQEEDEAAEAE